MLKWRGKEAHVWMPYDWTTNWIKPLHKGGDVNNVNSYRTIMVGSLMAKLFRCIKESKISVCAEKNGKRVYGQVSFRKHHNTINHLVIRRVLKQESRLRGKGLYCCFVHFKKAFDVVPREYL